MKKIFALSLAFLTLATLSLEAGARNKDRDFRRGKGGRRGNENSERVTAISVGQANYQGNGCPAGTMQAVFAPDNLSFSILFDQFVAEIQTKGRDVMNCSALIPISIPNNVQMEITRVDFRGFVNLPSNKSKAVLNSVFNFRGPGGDRDRMTLHYRFDGPSTTDYEISTSTLNDAGQTVDQTELSPCGGSFNLRITNQLVVQSKEPGAQVTIDSIDGSSNAVYYVNWRACSATKKPHNEQDNDRRWR
jgi:hypothetical protein